MSFGQTGDGVSTVAHQYGLRRSSILGIENRSASEVSTTSPEKLATCVIEGFEVTDNIECSLQFTPTELTSTVKVRISIDGLNNIKDATCRLGGIHASILLHNGQRGEKMITQEFSIGNPTFH